jgi:hypothetical protein
VVSVFLRFVTSEIDRRSGVEAGVFGAACGLYYSDRLPDYEDERLGELIVWFNRNLRTPSRFSRSSRSHGSGRAICWFRPTAREHLARIYEMVVILEDNGVFIRRIKAPKVGYVVYEDDHQVVAEPYADTRL